jgi:hypothetical protein
VLSCAHLGGGDGKVLGGRLGNPIGCNSFVDFRGAW